MRIDNTQVSFSPGGMMSLSARDRIAGAPAGASLPETLKGAVWTRELLAPFPQGVIAVYLNRDIAYSNIGIYTDGMKLSAWAKANGLAYQTAWRLWRAGKLPIPAEQLPTGTVIVHPPKAPTVESVAIDARVSSGAQKADLERQLGRLAWSARYRKSAPG